MQISVVDLHTDPRQLNCPAGRRLFLLIKQLAVELARLPADAEPLTERRHRIAELFAQVVRIEELFGNVGLVEARAASGP